MRCIQFSKILGFRRFFFLIIGITEANAKTSRKTTNPLPEVRARRGLTEDGLVGQIAVRGVSPSTTHYDRGWVARSSGEALLRKERLFFFLIIVLGENCQVTPAVTPAVPRSDVTSQCQVSRIVRTGTLDAVSSSFPAPIVKNVRVRADMAKNQCLDNFVTPCMSKIRELR